MDKENVNSPGQYKSISQGEWKPVKVISHTKLPLAGNFIYLIKKVSTIVENTKKVLKVLLTLWWNISLIFENIVKNAKNLLAYSF